MKNLGYFLLVFGLLNAQVWGQSARKNSAPVVIRCAALSCSSSALTHRNTAVVLGTFKAPTAQSDVRSAGQVKLNTFKPFQTAAPRVVLMQVSRLETGKVGTLLGKNNGFAVTIRR